MGSLQATRPQRHRASALVPWLVALVLLMQTLGLVHRVVHGSGGAHAHAQGAIGHLFDGHASDVDCRVFDQLSHGDGVAGVPVLALPLAFSAQVFQFFVGQALVRWAALFDARGPPLFSLR